MFKLIQSFQEYTVKIQHAEHLMELWYPSGHSSIYTQGEYRRASEERDKNQRLLDKTKDRIQKQFSKIKSRQSFLERNASLKMGDFNGWKVCHKFKSLNGSATIDLFGEYVFLCDENFNESFSCKKEDYDLIDKVMTIISSSDDFYEMVEKVQDEIF